jgi:hypothetical protein
VLKGVLASDRQYLVMNELNKAPFGRAPAGSGSSTVATL